MHHTWTNLTAALGLMASLVAARPSAREPCAGKAAYFITNDASNAVVALPIAADGTVSEGTITPTGGNGSNSINAMTGQPAAPDGLVSQGALTIAGRNLFAVNAGSNTVTMFSIDEEDPTKLAVVGSPVTVPAEFPNTVAVSAKHGLVCVGASGAVAGVSCARFDGEQGVTAPMDTLRRFDLGQTTPPAGPPNTVSHAFFSADENTLFATVKGDPAKNDTRGFIAAFPVTSSGDGAAAVDLKAMKSSPQGTTLLFGAALSPGTSGDLVVADPSFGAAVLSIDAATGAVTTKGKGDIAGQMATCWTTVSEATGSAFVADAGVDRLVEVSLADASVVGSIDLSGNDDPGLIDLQAARNFVYALSPGNGTTQAAIAVVNVVAKKPVQHFLLGGMGVGKNAQGMAVL